MNDSYLEQSAFCSSLHTRHQAAISDALAPKLCPKYSIQVENRTYREPLPKLFDTEQWGVDTLMAPMRGA